jgi:hypothetical protein
MSEQKKEKNRRTKKNKIKWRKGIKKINASEGRI